MHFLIKSFELTTAVHKIRCSQHLLRTKYTSKIVRIRSQKENQKKGDKSDKSEKHDCMIKVETGPRCKGKKKGDDAKKTDSAKKTDPEKKEK